MCLLSESVLRVEQNVNHVEVIDAERKTFAALGAGRGKVNSGVLSFLAFAA
jgi:hypothetical protein